MKLTNIRKWVEAKGYTMEIEENTHSTRIEFDAEGVNFVILHTDYSAPQFRKGIHLYVAGGKGYYKPTQKSVIEEIEETIEYAIRESEEAS